MKTTIQNAITTCAAGAAIFFGGLFADEARAQNNAAAAFANAAARLNASVYAAVAQEDLGHLSVVNQGTTRYRYSREGVVWNLVDRNGHWSLAEAKQLRDGLDRLPINYVRKARSSGADKFYRDADHPVVPLDSVFGLDEASAVAVPMWPFNYVAFSDSSFRDADATYSIAAHELGHCVHWYLFQTSPGTALSFSSFSWVQAISLIGDNGMKSWNGFTRAYARSNFREDFADSAAWYWHSPDGLYATNPSKYWYMRSYVYDGLVSPASARLNRQPDARVTPAISSLSSYSGDALTVRDVYGQYFMAPGDGGFNTVRFSQVTALHVPISRTHMYATVPASCNPSPNWYVTVETQDGKSNGVRFEVTKAWWRFW